VVFPEVYLERIIIDIILLLPATSFLPIADVAALVLVSAVSVQLIVSVKALSAETTLGMSLEATLVDCARVVVAKFLVFFQVLWGEELMLVGEYFLVPCTEITG
jgi:hypothetical protein